jgi:hypothetical protein
VWHSRPRLALSILYLNVDATRIPAKFAAVVLN